MAREEGHRVIESSVALADEFVKKGRRKFHPTFRLYQKKTPRASNQPRNVKPFRTDRAIGSEIRVALRNPKLLTAALDLALACVKCYELDKADAIYRRVLGECRRRGMPWDVMLDFKHGPGAETAV